MSIPREVVVTSGATEAITACLAALLNPGDEVVLIEPLYDTYLPVVRLLGASPRLVRLSPPDWSLPRAELAAAFGPRTKAILLNTPMNPTGKVFTTTELGVIADLLVRHDAYAICDEVYEHLVFDGWRHIPLMTLPGLRDRVMRIGSAGKTFSLTGWKVGYITAPAPLWPAWSPAPTRTSPSPPRPTCSARSRWAWPRTPPISRRSQPISRPRRDRLSAGLAALGMSVLPTRGSYFITADFRPLGFNGDDMEFCRHITEHAGVTAVPVTAFYDDPDPPRHYARFAFCKRESVLDEAVSRLRAHFLDRRLTAAGPPL